MLPKTNRLTSKEDFENVKQNGRFISNKYFTVSYVKNSGGKRFGFIVSKKVSPKAHERNRIKRVLREVVRKNLANVKEGVDCVVIAKRGILARDFDEHEMSFHDRIELELIKTINSF